MRKKPPKGSVRRAQPIGNNYRFFFDSKTGEDCQSESFMERVHALKQERDPRVIRYVSQPETFNFINKKGKKRHYTPDYRVWMEDGHVEVHEVTLEERRQKESSQQREAAGEKICAERGEIYRVFNEEETNRTEAVNLYTFYGYSARCRCDQRVYDTLLVEMEPGVKYKVRDVAKGIATQLGVLPGVVVATIAHMIWHQKLNTDMKILFFLDGEPNKDAVVWRE